MNLQKVEDEISLINLVYQEQLDHSSQDERIPEFDLIGTALNDV
jgi:hypothetical protein